jgi:hypothetical protein
MPPGSQGATIEPGSRVQTGGSGMPYLIAGLVVAFMLFMLIGGLSGRVRANTCCSNGDQAWESQVREVALPTDESPQQRASS